MQILLAAATASVAGAQTFTFTSCSGAVASVSAISVLPTGPIAAGATTTYGFGLVGSFSLTANGSTTSTTGFGSAAITYGNPGGFGQMTALSIQSPLAQSGKFGWSVTLEGAGTLFTPGTFPSTLPPLSSWNLPWLGAQGMSFDYISLSPGVKSFLLGCGDTTSGGGGAVPGETLGDPSSQPGCAFCPYPVNLGTGNMFEQIEDYHTTGANRLAFMRYYNSMAASTTFAASLGKNWRSNYDRYLDLSATSVIAERPDGQQVTFTANAGAWTTDTDIDMTLTNSGSTWVLTDHHDTVETYTAVSASEGLLQTIKARNGYTQTLLYNTTNQLTSVTDSFNRQLTFVYNSALLQSVTTPDNSTLTYGFTANVLSSISYSTSPVTSQTYVYENSSFPSALTGVIDENGARYMTWTYDASGRVLTSQLGGGANLTTIVYNDTDGSRTATNALGQQEVYKFATLQGVPKVIEVDRAATSTTAAATSLYTYDSNGYMASHTDWNGNITTLANDSHGQPTTINEAVGTPQARTTSITYHSVFRLPAQIVAPGVTTNLNYDSAGELLTKSLTDTTTGTVPYSTNGQTRTWTFTWSNFLEASVKSPRTDLSSVTSFTYDASGALIGVKNAMNQTLQVTQHLPGGLPQTTVDPNGVTTNRTYDARQRLLSSAVTTAAGALTTTFTYDAAGSLLDTTQPDGSTLTSRYDAAHRLSGVSDTLGDSIVYTLDALGDRTEAALLDASSTQQLQRSGVYDVLGRVLESIRRRTTRMTPTGIPSPSATL
jgi:YD repeat-containing protein